MKKRVITVLLSAMLIMSALVLASCGGGGNSDSPFVGSWECVKIEASGMELTPEEADLTFSVEIKGDGTLEATTNGKSDGAGKWEEDGDGIKITDASDTSIAGTMDGEQLILDFTDSGIVFTMEKK